MFSRIMNMKCKLVDGFPAYRIWEDGKLESCWLNKWHYPGMEIEVRWRTVMVGVQKTGYMSANLRGIKASRRTHIHRIVLEAFGGRKPGGKVCARHIDGNTRNNHISNLMWGTYKQNEDDKRIHGTWHERISNAKLDESSMKIAIEMRTAGSSMESIARRLCVSRTTISRLLSGSTWKHIDKNKILQS